MPRMLNPTNHMRTTDVGAFPLPSVARLALLPLSRIRRCDVSRQTAMKCDLGHCDRISLATHEQITRLQYKNREIDNGTNAGCMPGVGRPSAVPFSLRSEQRRAGPTERPR